MSRPHGADNPWRLSPSPPPVTAGGLASSSKPSAPIKRETWRPQPSSSWTPGGRGEPSNTRGANAIPVGERRAGGYGHGHGQDHGARRSSFGGDRDRDGPGTRSGHEPDVSPRQASREVSGRRDERQRRDSSRAYHAREDRDRRWQKRTSWKDRRSDDTGGNRDQHWQAGQTGQAGQGGTGAGRKGNANAERRVSGGTGWKGQHRGAPGQRGRRDNEEPRGGAGGSAERNIRDSGRGRDSPSPRGARRGSPEYGVGSRKSPNSGRGRRDSEASGNDRSRPSKSSYRRDRSLSSSRSPSPPRRRRSPSTDRDHDHDRKRPPSSPRQPAAKRQRDYSPAPSYTSSKPRGRSPSSSFSPSPPPPRRRRSFTPEDVGRSPPRPIRSQPVGSAQRNGARKEPRNRSRDSLRGLPYDDEPEPFRGRSPTRSLSISSRDSPPPRRRDDSSRRRPSPSPRRRSPSSPRRRSPIPPPRVRRSPVPPPRQRSPIPPPRQRSPIPPPRQRSPVPAPRRRSPGSSREVASGPPPPQRYGRQNLQSQDELFRSGPRGWGGRERDRPTGQQSFPPREPQREPVKMRVWGQPQNQPPRESPPPIDRSPIRSRAPQEVSSVALTREARPAVDDRQPFVSPTQPAHQAFQSPVAPAVRAPPVQAGDNPPPHVYPPADIPRTLAQPSARPPPIATGGIKISFGNISKPLQKSAVQHLFEEPSSASSAEAPSRTASPAPNGRASRAASEMDMDMDMDMDLDSPVPAQHGRLSPSDPRGLRPHHAAHAVSFEHDRTVDEREREYHVHLASVAPYINAAFQAWSAEPAAPHLPGFLVHYFGRPPTEAELAQIQQMLEMRSRMARGDGEARMLHLQREWVQSERDRSAPAPTRHEEPSHRPASAPFGTQQINGNGDGVTATLPPPQPSPSLEQRVQPLQPAEPGETYERLACVGEGTYGKVYKARNVETGEFVALKRIRMEGEKDGFPVTAMREIKLLQSLRQENVLRLIEIMVSKGSVFMVFEYMHHDLTGLLAHPNIRFTPANIKSLNHQMLKGLAYLHHRGILHRDMKGSNILLNSRGELKLADFGLARFYSKRRVQDYTNRVITLWYRPPELLLGETAYGPEVDMWSAGCIMLELFVTKPVFQGNDEIHQLEVIYSVMGTPRESDWPSVKELPWYELVKPKQEIPSKFGDTFSKWLSPAAKDLAEGLLHFDPKKRLSATAALRTAYFASEDPPMEMPTNLAGVGEYHELDAKQERARRRQEGR